MRRSHRRGLLEHLLSLASVYPLRCQACGHRFKALPSRGRAVPPGLDRRQYDRLVTHVPIIFAASGNSGESRTGGGVVRDISLGGCYLQTATPPAVGTRLSLELQPGANTPAILVETAIVRTVQPGGLGVEFLHLDEAAQEHLSQLVRQLLNERHDDSLQT